MHDTSITHATHCPQATRYVVTSRTTGMLELRYTPVGDGRLCEECKRTDITYPVLEEADR